MANVEASGLPSGDAESRPAAVVLAHHHLRTRNAKTTHGLLRGPSRYYLTAVVDSACAGNDAGQVAFGERCGVPVVATLAESLALTPRPSVCVIGVATPGGTLPPSLRQGILEAADAGLNLVNGLHHLLAQDPEISRRVAAKGGAILDIRKPPPVAGLRFWTGEVHTIRALRVAVLGTDCAQGKRTTTTLLLDACRERGLRAERIYTGQTGWLQGVRHGFIFDATPNDFVCGELEKALLACAADGNPDLILMEGQSGLRNPSGPCGSEFILAGAADGVILQHAPGRRYYEGLELLGLEIRPVKEDVELVRLLGCEVLAITLSHEGLQAEAARTACQRIAGETGLTTALPLLDGIGDIADQLVARARALARGKGRT
jgi:uncharacterized NAD-dependent epimerase/dehydratase family protein